MNLSDLLGPAHVFADLRAADKSVLLHALASRAATLLGTPPAEIAAALAAREALGSTGVGRGIAVPHAYLVQLPATAAFLARLERPVDYAAVDEQPVDLVFLLLGPPAARSEHLAALAAATRRLRNPATAKALRMTKEAEEMRDRFLAEPAET